MKKTKKIKITAAVIAALTAAAVGSISLAVASAKRHSAELADPDIIDSDIEITANSFIVEHTSPIHLEDELKPKIDEILSQIQAQCGGDWTVYIYVPSTGDELSINNKKNSGKKMQAASVIKLFIMGAAYENYDRLIKECGEDAFNEMMENMITISDNWAADELVTYLGNGDEVKGRAVVNDFCKSHGFDDTSMDRMMGDEIISADNYTTVEDTGHFLNMVLNAELAHSKEMMNYLKKQTRVNKIPEGLPGNVMSANKTGELDDVENDAAIVFAGKPYILCVMSDGVNDFEPPIEAIAKISAETYNYLAPILVHID